MQEYKQKAAIPEYWDAIKKAYQNRKAQKAKTGTYPTGANANKEVPVLVLVAMPLAAAERFLTDYRTALAA